MSCTNYRSVLRNAACTGRMNTLRSSARLLAGAAATTAAAAAATGFAFASSPPPALCHGGHSQPSAAAVASELVALSERLAALEAAAATAAGRHGVATTTGQGGAVFSWEERLTACFPVRRRERTEVANAVCREGGSARSERGLRVEGRRGLAGQYYSHQLDLKGFQKRCLSLRIIASVL